MAGIDREIQTRMDAANNNPQAAMQRYGRSQSVLDLISAQLLANQNAEADNAIKAMFTGSNQTELQRLNQQNATSAQNDVMRAIMPGVAQKAARDQQAMQRQAMGIPSQPAPNMRLADGGIVGFSAGGVGKGDRPIPQGQPSAASQDAEAKDIDNYIKAYRAYEASLANAPTAEEKQDVEARFKISQQGFDSGIRTKAHQKMSAESSMKGMDDFQGGGVVALKEGGGIGEALSDLLTLATRTPFTPEGERSNFGKLLAAIPRGLMGLLQRDKIQPLSEEEVLETMSQYGLDSGYADPRLRDVGRGDDDTGIMAMVRSVDEPTTPPETMYVPSRAEQFSQMFPDVRKAVNESEGTEMGGIKYLQMIGEMQAKAKEDEARRALNYIKMMADNRGMIDAADPAANIPKFAGPEGSLVKSQQEYADLGAEIQRLMDYEKTLPIFDGQRKLLRQRRSELGRQRDDMMSEQITPQYEAAQEEIARQAIAEQGFDLGTTEADNEGKTVEMFDELTRGKTREANNEGVTAEMYRDAATRGAKEEPVKRRGLAGLLDKIEENADMSRLRAFLRGGAGQTSVASALAGGDRSLAAEDLRQRQLDVQETDVLGRIAASRYGSELDYRAALANLRQDERKMIFEADQKLREQYLGAEQDAAKTFLSDLEDDQLFSSQFMRLQQEFEGAQLAAETAALKEKYLDDYMNAYRRSGLGVSTGTFGYTAPSE